jgi:hypothetical protein
VNCPWCDAVAGPRALHAHLGERHGDMVSVGQDKGATFYLVTCPRCGDRYRHLVRKGARDPGFTAEFDREIRLVALDMLVHHLAAEHEDSQQRQTGGPGDAPGQ